MVDRLTGELGNGGQRVASGSPVFVPDVMKPRLSLQEDGVEGVRALVGAAGRYGHDMENAECVEEVTSEGSCNETKTSNRVQDRLPMFTNTRIRALSHETARPGG